MAMMPTKLTGRARFRQSWRGQLILQVEEHARRDRALVDPGPLWRDAGDLDLIDLRIVRERKGEEPLL